MNLLIISSWWDFSKFDGTSSYNLNLINLMADSFESIYLLFPNRPDYDFKYCPTYIQKTFRYLSYVFRFPVYHFLDYNPFYYIILKKVVKEYNIGAVFISFPWGAKYLKKMFPNMLIFNGSIGFEYEYSDVAFQAFPRFLSEIMKRYIYHCERQAFISTDMIISISDRLTQQIQKFYQIPCLKISTLKMGFDFIESHRKLNKIEIRKKYNLPTNQTFFIFHGGIRHFPNLDAINLIKTSIAPQIAKIDKNIAFCIVGKGNHTYHKDNIYSFNYISDLDEMIHAMDGAIIPIVSGSGLRIKAMDYIRNNIPVISTKKGIEGYGFTQEEIITVDSVNDEFIQAILWVSQHSDLTSLMAQRCYTKAIMEFNNHNLQAKFEKGYSALLKSHKK